MKMAESVVLSTANALCVDVDDLAGSSIEIGRSLKNAEYLAESEVDSLLEELAALSVHATFFVPGFTVDRWPQLVKAIAAGGHEVASHGTMHCHVQKLGRNRFFQDVVTNKRILEDLTGCEVDTYKAPIWSITRDCLWAYDALQEAGFRVDHTAMPQVRAALGQSAAALEPFRHEGGMLIIPPTTISIVGIPVRFCGGFYNAYPPTALQVPLLRRINDRGLPFNFYFHPYEHSPHPINQRWLKFGSMYVSLYAAHSGVYRRRLRALAGKFRFTTLRESYRDWIA